MRRNPRSHNWLLEGWTGFWIGVVIAILIVATSQPSEASTPANITNTVGVCDPNFPQRCIAPGADGSLMIAGVTPSSDATTGIVPNATLGGSSITKGTPGNLFALDAVAPATAGFVQVFNLAAPPADASTNTPVWCLPLGANVGLDKIFNPPLVGTVGISVVFSSSTCGAALVKVNAIYLQFMVK